ncbi:MAG TPA: Rieske 2Fe-2S domain-containing protein [Gemmatimonadaceae bacterium]
MSPDRREFLRKAASVAAGGAIVGPLASMACAPAEKHPPRSFETTIDVASLTQDGQSLVAPVKGIDNYPILVVRKSADAFNALSMQCGHMGCPVNPPVGKVITCPCHGSRYDLNGKILNGPTQYPLAEYGTEVNAKARTLIAYVEA